MSVELPALRRLVGEDVLGPLPEAAAGHDQLADSTRRRLACIAIAFQQGVELGKVVRAFIVVEQMGRFDSDAQALLGLVVNWLRELWCLDSDTTLTFQIRDKPFKRAGLQLVILALLRNRRTRSNPFEQMRRPRPWLGTDTISTHATNGQTDSNAPRQHKDMRHGFTPSAQTSLPLDARTR